MYWKQMSGIRRLLTSSLLVKTIFTVIGRIIQAYSASGLSDTEGAQFGAAVVEALVDVVSSDCTCSIFTNVLFLLLTKVPTFSRCVANAV